MRLTALALLLLPLSSVQAATPLTMEQIMADPDWIGPAVESPYWSLDGKRVLYSLKREGSPLRDVHAVDVATGTSSKLDDAALASLDGGEPVYEPGSRNRVLFVRNGDVFLRDRASGALTQLTRTDAVESSPRFRADGRAALFQSGDDWMSVDLGTRLVSTLAVLKTEKDPDAAPEPDALRDMQLRLIATLAKERADRDALKAQDAARRGVDPSRAPAPIYLGEKLRIVSSALSPDARWLLVATAPQGDEATDGRGGKMPRYVTESGYEEVEDVRTRVGRNAPQPHTLWRVDLVTRAITQFKTDPLPGIAVDPLAELRRKAGKDALEGNRGTRVEGLRFSADGTRAAVMLRSIDMKDRWIATVTAQATALAPLHRLSNSAWSSWDFNEFDWLPDNRTLWYLSEETGFSHLYTVVPGSKPTKLTKGRWEVSGATLSADGTRFLFLCNRTWPGDYEVCAKPLDGGAIGELTALDGVEGFEQSPDGRQLLVRYSSSYLPQQIALVPAAGGEARVLTDTRNAAFRAIDWLQPRIVQVPSSHVKSPIWSKFYRPQTLEPGRKYPIVLFVHGAGYLQNTHAKYPNYFREQMFHNLLVQQGYLVLDMDYRASAGYGRDWRTAIYRQMGHPELEDLVDGVNWLVTEQQGDADNVGVYGGSYGGFMTFMALFRAPEVFKAGAALRPVTDWTQYNHDYTAAILNTPDIDPEAYARSSPIEYADAFRGHMLIAHGMIDDNVFYQDSVRLAQRLIELKKENWELASYPLERHAFVHADAWLDEYRRVYKLFERTLKPAAQR
ncbi:S9 family peptidase [Chiayiivirga flava]|uniref:Dipeptidyl aminopeptidase/acylaminoacyl peptidase n=1 Tax=Chiayiivirga flava TaxID=659595 RepID=A0A7W8D6Z6_9GAMM|nr:prolyl oligopeptidase family serine peptidase [Chiayiivirga flava]MBB5207857.1 dipeptidyl aminopeptidase/acylaminoacyl peptidase [Chiayiivirga flava]